MSETLTWHATGDWFDVCSCDVPCPCEFAQPPTKGHCEGVLAWHVREGRYGDVSLDGLNVVAIAIFDGNLWAGEAKLAVGVFLDERGDDAQRDALEQIFAGKAGGWPATFAANIGELRGVVPAPIRFQIDAGLAHWSVRVGEAVDARAEALSGPTTPQGTRVQLYNPPGSEVGPGQIATWGRGTRQRADAFGFRFDFTGTSSKHIPFAWTGPGNNAE